MEQKKLTAEERNPWPIPSINVLLNRLGYVLIGSHDVIMTEGEYRSWDSSVLHYRSQSERRNMLVWLGSMGWDPEGLDAYCDYKLFWFNKDQDLPSQLPYDKAKHTAVFWEWSAPSSYMQEPFGDHLIKPETVRWQEYKEIGFR
tara:strand:- start:729 stop:1160 length:432 start_codon:yes stop_codon:yes gene_type:complete